MIRLLIIFLFFSNLALCQIKTNYIIKNVSELNKEMYDNAKEISTNTCRKNVSGTKIILKCEGVIPDIFKDDTIYTYVEIHKELAKEEWVGYSEGAETIGNFFITDYRYKEDLTIKVSDWMYIQPIEIKERLWMIPYDLYIKYESLIDNKIDLYKCVIREVSKNEFINQNL